MYSLGLRQLFLFILDLLLLDFVLLSLILVKCKTCIFIYLYAKCKNINTDYFSVDRFIQTVLYNLQYSTQSAYESKLFPKNLINLGNCTILRHQSQKIYMYHGSYIISW